MSLFSYAVVILCFKNKNYLFLWPSKMLSSLSKRYQRKSLVNCNEYCKGNLLFFLTLPVHKFITNISRCAYYTRKSTKPYITDIGKTLQSLKTTLAIFDVADFKDKINTDICIYAMKCLYIRTGISRSALYSGILCSISHLYVHFV
jgi:hypothetical protein